MTPCSSPNGYQRSFESSVSTAFKNFTRFDPNGGVYVYLPLGVRGITNKMTWLVYVCVHCNSQEEGFSRFFDSEGKVQHLGHEP